MEESFWTVHKQLDEAGLKDRLVPIFKLWRALKGKMSREEFEKLLFSLADPKQPGGRKIQLERRTTMSGVSPQERAESLHTKIKGMHSEDPMLKGFEDVIYFAVRRLK